jgi:cyclopropane fatty-acyl-phospholipid synthase-like methyltransferase
MLCTPSTLAANTVCKQQERNRGMQNEDVNPEQVGFYYDEWSSRYEASFGDTFQACRPTETADLHRYILNSAGVKDGERILDAGCGICGPSIYFGAHREITIDAVTVSMAQVSTAQRLIADAGLSRQITVHLADFHKLDEIFPEATFDRVLFLESLSHATDPTGPLQSVFKVLKPGGIVYIKDFFEKHYVDLDRQRFVREIIGRVDRTFVLKTPRVEHTVEILKQVGFLEQYIGSVGFKNDIAVWAKFNQAHNFDLYDGSEPIEWCDWLDLRFQKPLRPDRE